MGSAEFSVTWKNHSEALSSMCKNLLNDNFLVDCTVTAEGQCLKAHRLILSACSPYFQLMFKQESEKHPIIFLKDTKFIELKALIDFVYRGEAQLPEDCLGAFFQLAQSLQIKGLKDTAPSNVNKMSPEYASRNSKLSPTSNFISKGSAVDAQVNLSNYRNSECVDRKTNVVQPNNSSETNPNHTPSYPSTVLTKLAKRNVSIHSEECIELSYREVNSPLVTVLQPPSSPGEILHCEEEAVKHEPDETEVLESNFEEIDVEINSANADDYPKNDTKRREMTFGYQIENLNHSKLMKPNTSIPSEDCNEFSYGQVNSTLVTSLQTSSSSVELLPCGEEAFNNQPDEIEIFEPKCEETDVEMGTETADDFPENDTEHEDITFGHQTENVNYQIQDHPTYENVEHVLSWHQPFTEEGVANSIHPLDNFSVPQPSEAPTRLKVRLQSRTEARPFKCEMCKAGFMQKWHLVDHMRCHTGERPFECDVCPAAFSHSSTLTNHKRSKHTGERPYKCDVCPAAFFKSFYLTCHKRAKHT